MPKPPAKLRSALRALLLLSIGFVGGLLFVFIEYMIGSKGLELRPVKVDSSIPGRILSDDELTRLDP